MGLARGRKAPLVRTDWLMASIESRAYRKPDSAVDHLRTTDPDDSPIMAPLTQRSSPFHWPEARPFPFAERRPSGGRTKGSAERVLWQPIPHISQTSRWQTCLGHLEHIKLHRDLAIVPFNSLFDFIHPTPPDEHTAVTVNHFKPLSRTSYSHNGAHTLLQAQAATARCLQRPTPPGGQI